MVEKLFGDRVVTMSGMERRQALRVFATAAITAPVAVFGLPAATANAATASAATAPTKSAPLPNDGGTASLPALQRLLNAEQAAGMIGTFACVRHGSRTSGLVAGCADTGTRRAPRTSMRHRVGDVTKTFTAATVVLLACEGRIDLDKPICTYLPDLLPTELGMIVTIRMLLNHTSCIADYEPVLFASAQGVVDGQRKRYTPADLVMCGLEMTGSVMPGEMFLYSDTNYVILGCLIEKITGEHYENAVERRILRPLRLEDTYFPGTDKRISGSHMTAYVPVKGMFCDVTDYDMSYAWAAGSLVSSANDVQRFYAALLGGRLLPSMGLREMLTAVPMDAANPQAGAYGLGIKCVPGEHGVMWGHDGYAPGHATFAWNSPDGRSVQLFQAENLTWYAGSHGSSVNAIDKARTAFEEAACR